MKKIKNILFLIFLIPFINPLSIIGNDELVQILKEELDRESNLLAEQQPFPYFIEYRVTDMQAYSLRASFGSLVGDNDSRNRLLTVTVRVGDYSFDNTHSIQGLYGMSEQLDVLGSSLPLENDAASIKQILWRLTDQAYKNAVSRYVSLMNRKDEKDKKQVADFTKEIPNKYSEPAFDNTEIEFNKEEWISRLKEITNFFNSDSLIFHSDASLTVITQRNYLVNTEGTTIAENSKYCQLQFMGSIRHETGMILPVHKTYAAFKIIDLPKQPLILEDIQKLKQQLVAMSSAPLAEPYSGPAILSSGAAGVFFHEIFGHRVEGHRLESVDDGQTFKDKLQSVVLPVDFQVYSDPSIRNWNGQDLIGAYKYDDQGVAGQKVILVKDGVLKSFLMSRKPGKEINKSNGHGRAQPGFAAVSRQSNLFIESSRPYTEEALRKMLIKECKKQKKIYGYYFKEVMGGLTITDRYNTNVFNINPIEVYRVYTDGRPDELVTGVELIGTPLTMFSNILAAGSEHKVFTGFCGAESGMVPVTTIAPSILVRKIETQKTPEYKSQLPFLPSPKQSYNP